MPPDRGHRGRSTPAPMPGVVDAQGRHRHGRDGSTPQGTARRCGPRWAGTTTSGLIFRQEARSTRRASRATSRPAREQGADFLRRPRRRRERRRLSRADGDPTGRPGDRGGQHRLRLAPAHPLGTEAQYLIARYAFETSATAATNGSATRTTQRRGARRNASDSLSRGPFAST